MFLIGGCCHPPYAVILLRVILLPPSNAGGFKARQGQTLPPLVRCGGGTGWLYNGWRVSWIPAFAGMTIVLLRDGFLSWARRPCHGKDSVWVTELAILHICCFVKSYSIVPQQCWGLEVPAGIGVAMRGGAWRWHREAVQRLACILDSRFRGNDNSVAARRCF